MIWDQYNTIIDTYNKLNKDVSLSEYQWKFISRIEVIEQLMWCQHVRTDLTKIDCIHQFYYYTFNIIESVNYRSIVFCIKICSIVVVV